MDLPATKYVDRALLDHIWTEFPQSFLSLEAM